MTMFRYLPVALPAILLLQGCGGDPEPTGGETATQTPEVTAAVSPEETAAPDMVPKTAVAASESPVPDSEPLSSGSETQPATAQLNPTPAPAASPAVSPSAAARVAAATPPAAPPAEFAICRACHSVEPGKNGVGPSLHGIVGEKAGAVPGFAFSAPLKASGIVWNRSTLDEWLTNPMKMVPGTKMVLPVSDAARRKAIIDYLVTLK